MSHFLLSQGRSTKIAVQDQPLRTAQPRTCEEINQAKYDGQMKKYIKYAEEEMANRERIEEHMKELSLKNKASLHQNEVYEDAGNVIEVPVQVMQIKRKHPAVSSMEKKGSLKSRGSLGPGKTKASSSSYLINQSGTDNPSSSSTEYNEDMVVEQEQRIRLLQARVQQLRRVQQEMMQLQLQKDDYQMMQQDITDKRILDQYQEQLLMQSAQKDSSDDAENIELTEPSAPQKTVEQKDSGDSGRPSGSGRPGSFIFNRQEIETSDQSFDELDATDRFNAHQNIRLQTELMQQQQKAEDLRHEIQELLELRAKQSEGFLTREKMKLLRQGNVKKTLKTISSILAGKSAKAEEPDSEDQQNAVLTSDTRHSTMQGGICQESCVPFDFQEQQQMNFGGWNANAMHDARDGTEVKETPLKSTYNQPVCFQYKARPKKDVQQAAAHYLYKQSVTKAIAADAAQIQEKFQLQVDQADTAYKEELAKAKQEASARLARAAFALELRKQHPQKLASRPVRRKSPSPQTSDIEVSEEVPEEPGVRKTAQQYQEALDKSITQMRERVKEAKEKEERRQQALQKAKEEEKERIRVEEEARVRAAQEEEERKKQEELRQEKLREEEERAAALKLEQEAKAEEERKREAAALKEKNDVKDKQPAPSSAGDQAIEVVVRGAATTKQPITISEAKASEGTSRTANLASVDPEKQSKPAILSTGPPSESAASTVSSKATGGQSAAQKLSDRLKMMQNAKQDVKPAGPAQSAPKSQSAAKQDNSDEEGVAGYYQKKPSVSRSQTPQQQPQSILPFYAKITTYSSSVEEPFVMRVSKAVKTSGEPQFVAMNQFTHPAHPGLLRSKAQIDVEPRGEEFEVVVNFHSTDLGKYVYLRVVMDEEIAQTIRLTEEPVQSSLSSVLKIFSGQALWPDLIDQKVRTVDIKVGATVELASAESKIKFELPLEDVDGFEITRDVLQPEDLANDLTAAVVSIETIQTLLYSTWLRVSIGPQALIASGAAFLKQMKDAQMPSELERYVALALKGFCFLLYFKTPTESRSFLQTLQAAQGRLNGPKLEKQAFWRQTAPAAKVVSREYYLKNCRPEPFRVELQAKSLTPDALIKLNSVGQSDAFPQQVLASVGRRNVVVQISPLKSQIFLQKCTVHTRLMALSSEAVQVGQNAIAIQDTTTRSELQAQARACLPLNPAFTIFTKGVWEPCKAFYDEKKKMLQFKGKKTVIAGPTSQFRFVMTSALTFCAGFDGSAALFQAEDEAQALQAAYVFGSIAGILFDTI